MDDERVELLEAELEECDEKVIALRRELSGARKALSMIAELAESRECSDAAMLRIASIATGNL